MCRAPVLVAIGFLGCGCAAKPDPAGDRVACATPEPPFGIDVAAGDSFPDVGLTTCDGIRTSLEGLRCGHELTVVSVGAGWCGPCIEETPALEAAAIELAPQGVAVLQILVEDAKANPATTLFCQTWVESFGLTLPVFVDPAKNTVQHFDTAALPVNFIEDRAGRVRWALSGTAPEDLPETVRSLLTR